MSEYVIWNELGNVYIKMGAINDAISAYLKAIEMNPGYGWPYSNMAFAHTQKGDYEEAIRLYKRSIELLKVNKHKAISWNGLGDTYRLLQDYQSALEAYQMADQISNEPDPLSDDLHDTIIFPEAILAEDELGKSQGISIPGESLFQFFDDSAQEESQINCLLDQTVEVESERSLNAATEQSDHFSPDDDQPESQSDSLSEWLRELLQADAQKEIRSLELVSRVNKKDTIPIGSTFINELDNHISSDSYAAPEHMSGAEESHALGDANPSVLELATQVEYDLYAIDPSYQSYINTEEKTKVDRQPDWSIHQPVIPNPPKPQQTQFLDPVTAEIKKYEKIVSLNETNDRAWDTLGKLYKSLGRYDDAVQAFERAIALAPHHEAYHYNQGLVFTVQNRYLDAIESFQNAIALNDQYILAHGALAGCYRRLGKDEEAADHINVAIPMMADESEYNRACFNAICGNNDQAIDLLRMALTNQDVSLEWVQSDPDLDGIRDDARYKALIQEIQRAMVAE